MKEARKTQKLKSKLLIIGCLLSVFTLSAQYTPAANVQEKNLLPSLNKTYLDINTDLPLALSIIRSKDTYMPSLGAFCLLEEEMTKSSRMPIKLRLGSQDYVDKLEKKSN